MISIRDVNRGRCFIGPKQENPAFAKMQSMHARINGFNRCYSEKSVFSRIPIFPKWIKVIGSLCAVGLLFERVHRQSQRQVALEEAQKISIGSSGDSFPRSEVDQIYEIFRKGHKIAFLHGFGGTGKSTVGRQYAANNCANIKSNYLWGQHGKYTGVIRIDAIDNKNRTSVPKIIEGMSDTIFKIKTQVGAPIVSVQGTAIVNIADIFKANIQLKDGGVHIKFPKQMRADLIKTPPAPNIMNGGWTPAQIAAEFAKAVNILTSSDVRNSGGKWLLIFDNVDSPAAFAEFIGILFPGGLDPFENVDILISGRYAGSMLGRITGGVRVGFIPMGFFDQPQQAKLFDFLHKQTIPKPFDVNPGDLEVIFSHTLCYPFFVATAVSYCAQEGSTKKLAQELTNGIPLDSIFANTFPNMLYPKTPRNIYDVYIEDVIQDLKGKNPKDVLKLLHTLPYMPNAGELKTKDKLSNALVYVWGGKQGDWASVIHHLIRHSIIDDTDTGLRVNPFASKLFKDVHASKWQGAFTGFFQLNPEQREDDAKKIANKL